MDASTIINALTGAPLSLVLLWLLIQAQKDAAEVRRQRDAENHEWIERFAALADRVSSAVERLDLPGPK